MTLLTISLVQAGGAASPSSTLLPLVFQVAAIVAIFYFIVVRPQQRERKRLEQTLLELKRGDEVITGGGIIGEVVFVQGTAAAEGQTAQGKMEDRITIKSGESKFIVERRGIARVQPKGA